MDFGWSVQLALVGIGVVFATLLALQLVLTVPRWLGRIITAPNPKREAAEQQSAIPPEHVAAIAAAVALHCSGTNRRIRTIRPLIGANWEHSRYINTNSVR